MTFLTELAEVLQNSNNALAGVFLRNHAKEIVALVEAAEEDDWVGIQTALDALNKEQSCS